MSTMKKCLSCRHWRREGQSHFGYCLAIPTKYTTRSDEFKAYMTAPSSELTTRYDFGCVLHEVEPITDQKDVS